MKTYRVLLVDDEPLARSSLRQLLKRTADFVVAGEAENGVEALAAIRRERPDLVFLDVQMPGLTGLELIDALGGNPAPQIIFITAHRQFAVKAFEFFATDYLVKPFSNERFFAALERARHRLESPDIAELSDRVSRVLEEFAADRAPVPAVPAAARSAEQTLLVKADGELHFIDPDDLIWVEGHGDYLKLHTRNGPHPVIRETFKALAQRIDERFLRIHKSTLVNVDHLVRMRALPSGDYVVRMRSGAELRLSRLRKAALDALLQRRATAIEAPA